MDDGSQLDGNGNHETLSERSIFPQDWSLKEIKCFSFSFKPVQTNSHDNLR